MELFDSGAYYESKEFKRLSKRIKREFTRVMYIGDIKINDDEYALLKRYMVDTCRMFFRNSSGKSNDPILATALVQFGIHEYDGRFWPHFKSLFPMENIGQGQCNLIGKIFVYTLKHNNKKCLGYDQMVDSILMQAFVTDYYANSLFDFLLKYYELDLDRNLDNHTKEMRDYLIYSMKRDDNLGRSYKIRRHTADAITANEIGCKIRIKRILKMIDNYMFYDYDESLERSTNRITKLFVEWAKQSKDFAYERRKYSSVGRKGRKYFSSPYLKFDTDSKSFCLKLPVQNIPLSDDELDATVSWRISYSGCERKFEVETEESVTGCKTLKFKIPVDSKSIFSEFRVELLKNETDVVRKFVIKPEEVRFFDKDWDLITIFDDYIPSGDCFAFSEDEIECFSASPADVELCSGLNLYTLYLENGDIIKYPSGIAKPVGKEFEDGILPHSYVPGAVVKKDDKDLMIYSAAPIINFTAEEKQIPGTIIWINGKRNQLAENNYVSFNYTANSKKKYCILKMDSFGIEEGIYSVAIDIPGSKKDYYFEFAVIDCFGFEFDGAPYIFKNRGFISFDFGLEVESVDGEVELVNNSGSFDILEDYDELLFKVANLNVSITIPALKWMMEDEWRIDKPEPIWYTEFPDKILIKYPGDSVEFSMDIPEVLDAEDAFEGEEDDNYATAFKKLKGSDVIECDTTKMKSWFGRHDAIRQLKIDLGNGPFTFVHIVTKCILNKCELIADYNKSEFNVKADIIGIADCFVDFYRDDELIAEKVEIRTKGAIIPTTLKDGNYNAIFFEQDDEEDEFGFGEVFYQEFDNRKFSFVNKYDLSGKQLIIKNISEIVNPGSIFAPDTFTLGKKYYIDSICPDPETALSYTGVLHCEKSDEKHDVYFSIANAKRPEVIKLYAVQNNSISSLAYTVDKELLPASKTNRAIKIFKASEYDFNVIVK